MQHIELLHSWQGRTAHVMRKHGHVCRCTIGRLDVFKGEVSVLVVFNEGNVLKQKAVSPLLVASTNVFWLLGAAVSSDEEDDNKQPIAAPDVNHPLPALFCSNASLLSAEQQRKLKWMLTQVNDTLSLLHRVRMTTAS